MKHVSFISWIQYNVKTIITITVSLFIGSVFFIGLGGSLFNARARKKQTDAEVGFKDKLRQEKLKDLPISLKTKLAVNLATVNFGSRREQINVEEFYSALKRDSRYQQMVKMQASGVQATYLKRFLERKQRDILMSLIEQRLVVLAALKAKLGIKERAEKIFKNLIKEQGGNYEAILNRFLQKGLSEKELKDLILFQASLQMLREHYLKKSKISKLTASNLKKIYQEHREMFRLPSEFSIRNILIKPGDFISDIKITDADIEGFYKSNSEKFMSSKRKKLAHILIDPTSSQIQNMVKVSNGEKSKYYNQHIQDYTKEDRVHARHILVNLVDSLKFPFKDYAIFATSLKRMENASASFILDISVETAFEIADKLKEEDFQLKNNGNVLDLDKEETEKKQDIPENGFTIAPEQKMSLVFKLNQTEQKDSAKDTWTLSIKGQEFPCSFLLNPDEKENDSSKLAMIIGKRLKSGDKFEDLARKFSSDTASAEKGGDLGFFTRGKMVKAFEAACFAGKKGDITEPVKSPFGLHIIEIIDKKPQRTIPYPEVHLEIEKLLKSKQAKKVAEDRIKEALEKLKKGEKFSDLVKIYSTAKSKARAGELGILFKGTIQDYYPEERIEQLKGEVTTGFALDSNFEQHAFSLKPGKFSSVFNSNFGFHIVKNLENLK
ncbi:peptidylprolyl isomerase, partial [Candidatus Riflebacteria bacterium]